VPAFVARELLAEEDVPVERFERGREHVSRGHVAASPVNGAELVARAVAEEADDAREAPPPGIEGEDGRDRAVGRPRRVQEQLVLAAEVLPPDPAPEPGREDAPRALGEGVPFRLEAAEVVHGLRARYNFRRLAMTDVRTHPSIAKRVVRPVARVVGVPVGVAFMLVLRLTGRKAGVALMYHSVDRRAGDPARELVPPHEVGLFEHQLRHVVRHYDVVPADRLLEAVSSRRRGQRFPVAITFDDDLACHATLAAPILRDLGVSATFFLSGASLDRPFSFHFERLQRAWDTRVPELASVVIGDRLPHTLHELGGAMVEMTPEERDRAAERLLAAAGPDPDDAGMRRSQVRELVDAGMTVGFHTYRHDPMTGLTDTQLADALRVGRSELEEVTGEPVDVIGYPHGRADERVAMAARTAGFRFGYCTRRVPVTPTSSPWLLGRFGPSLRSVGALALELAFTLVKRETAGSSPAPERAPS
jgi:peptidoglycan/xylan/chitin deacetylase (PgdA/CDA1 family)